MNDGMFSSESDEWATPPEFFAKLDRIFAFQLDVAADATNAKCARFFTKKENGLLQKWANRNWMNPPYGKTISDWVKKADEEAENGNLTVALLPARTDTAWFHKYCAKWHCVFLRGRIKFERKTGGGRGWYGSIPVYDCLFWNLEVNTALCAS